MTASTEPRKLYPRGTYSAIARQLGIKPQTVRLVAMGACTSARVSAALRLVEQRESRRHRRRKAATAAV